MSDSKKKSPSNDFETGIEQLRLAADAMGELGKTSTKVIERHNGTQYPRNVTHSTPVTPVNKIPYSLSKSISNMIHTPLHTTDKYHESLLRLWKNQINRGTQFDNKEDLEQMKSYLEEHCGVSNSMNRKCKSLREIIDYYKEKTGETGGKKRRVTKRRKSRLTKTKRRKSRL